MVLEGFTAHKIHVKGTVRMQVTLGTDDRMKTEEVKLYVVDIDSPRNTILGMPSHAAFDLVISMSHQQVKFSTGRSVGFLKNSPKSLLDYIIKIKRKRDEEELTEINMINTREESRVKKLLEQQITNFVMEVSKNEKFEEVLINPEHLQQRIKIASEMPKHMWDEVVQFLTDHKKASLGAREYARNRYFGQAQIEYKSYRPTSEAEISTIRWGKTVRDEGGNQPIIWDWNDFDYIIYIKGFSLL